MLATYEVVEDDDNCRHISIFNSRVNSMIMDLGTCANIISERLSRSYRFEDRTSPSTI
jgi:hypothetical protein